MAPSTQKPDVWELFLASARRIAEMLRPMVKAGKDLARNQLDAISRNLAVLESASWMVGAEELAESVRALRRGVRSQKAPGPSEITELGSALGHLNRAVHLMGREDGDDTQLVEELKAMKELGQSLTIAEPEEISPSTPASPAETAGLADQGVWTPQVDPDLLPPFVEECGERLQGLSDKLLTLEQQPDDKALVADIFRDLHTVKGSSAFVGLDPLNRLSHAAEDLVGQIREGTLSGGSQVVDVLLSATDLMTVVLQKAVSGEPMGDLGLQAMITSLKSPQASPPAAPPPLAPAPEPGGGTARPAAPAKPTGGDGQTIRVDFSKLDVLLNLVGELVLDKASLRSVLEGLDSTIRALDTQSRQIRRNLWGVRTPLSEGGTKAWNAKRPELMVRTLNEELGRVERVLRELTQEMDLSVGGLDFVSGQLRDQVMKLRMVPIASVFAKHRRNVRDLSRSLGKKVRLELEGQETELDKMLVEQLDEPLLHLVRNAVDHGIESPEDRLEKGKPAEGWLKLKAEQRGNQFVVEVSDDGGGIDAEQLRRKAITKGILTPQRASELTVRECLDLVFSPGFSTASSVTDLSGRGVGLDVVKEVISRLRGTVEVTSSADTGTTFTLSLPLTLAIRQVLLLRVAGELTALPIDHLKRSLEIRPDQIHHLVDRDVLKLNDHHLPLIWLHRMLGLGPRPRWEGQNTLHVVQVNVLGHTYGLVCDGLEGKREIVIKSLGDLLTRVPCVAGATLVGDRVVLILDLPDLVRAWIRRELKQPAAVESDEPAPARRTVLLAEDSDPMREMLRQQFEQLGFQVLEAADGLEALELAESGSFDLVSTDAMMPNMDGYDLTRALRQDPRHKDVPIIMISVRGERIDKVRGFDAGVDGYLVKPTDITELNAMVRKLLAAQSDEQKPEPEAS